MAIWLYPLTSTPRSQGYIEVSDGGQVDATSEKFIECILDARLKTTTWWGIRNLYKKICIHDEMYIYGGKRLIGYAIVIDKNDEEKEVKLKFDIEKSQNIIEAKIYRELFKDYLIKAPGRWATVIQIDEALNEELEDYIVDKVLPEISSVEPELSETSLVKVRKKSDSPAESKSVKRYAKNAKVIGDRAELIVKSFLEKTLSLKEKNTLRWLAKEGVTPGYDFSYFDLQNNEICVEVKGTIGKIFNDFNITINEWNAAEKQKENYYVYFVTECLTRKPKIYKLQNILKMQHDQILKLEAIAFRVSVVGSGL